MGWTTERWARIEELFHAAAPLDAAARARFLAEQCGPDDELRAAVAQMVAADAADADGADAWLEQGVGPALRGSDALLGARIGAFELVERIADGGMGSVYRARRVGADFDQEVAVKVLRLGLSTPAMRERFARERQTLARLVHPNVARLIDGGTTAEGVPFFAMEFVDGEPLDRFCDARQMPLRTRLELFAVVCRAVQFAHQNLVVHLDLKPTNILVDRRGGPKLLDFGVAGLLSDFAEGSASVAATRSRPLTPEYASPEQLRGEPVTTAADVYALGVVLYELLTGRRPFRRTGGDLELARTVCDTEPPRPSTAFGDVDAPSRGEGAATPTALARAEARGGRPRDVERTLRGDLDRVVAKAMAKDPRHRYATCEDLAADVERFLGGFPVLARPASVARRVAKFVRRNALLVGAAGLVLLSLVGGIVATTHMASVARLERDAAADAKETAQRERDLAAAASDEARRERDAAAAAQRRAEHDAGHARIESMSSQLVAQFLGETFLSSGTLAEPGERARVLATIERRAEQVRRRHGGDDHLRANLLHSLGRACIALDAFERAEQLLQEAAAIRKQSFGERSLEHALSLGSIGQLHYRQGRFDDAARVLRTAYELHRECPRDVHTDVAMAANDLAAAERARGDEATARTLHQEALALRREGGDPVLIAESLNNLANSEPDLAVARGQLEESLRLRREILGEHDPLTIQSAANLGTLCLRVGDFTQARALLRDAVARSRPLAELGTDGIAVALRSLAYAELRLGDADAATTAIDEALRLERERFGENHARVAGCLEVKAAIVDRRDPAAALAIWREVVRIRTATLPAGHRQTGLARHSLGAALVRAGELADGIATLQDAVATLAAHGAPAAGETLDARMTLATAHERGGDAAAAEGELLEALALSQQVADARRRAAVRAQLRAHYLRHDRPDDAARYATDDPAK